MSARAWTPSCHRAVATVAGACDLISSSSSAAQAAASARLDGLAAAGAALGVVSFTGPVNETEEA
jgi:hypothetical protein